jgi:hypothetical protein
MNSGGYRDQLLGELRVLEAFGLYGVLPDALQWAPGRNVVDRIVAEGLQRIQRASAIWNLRMGYRRMQGALMKGVAAISPEWDIFEEAS